MVDAVENVPLDGASVEGLEGQAIGKAVHVFRDGAGRPQWVTVKSGMLGTGESFIPLREAVFEDGVIKVPYRKSQVDDAPNVVGEQLQASDEESLYNYYGLSRHLHDVNPHAVYARDVEPGSDLQAPGTAATDDR